MELHRIDLRPELRPQAGYERNDRRLPRPYRGEIIGQSNQPLYAAARWLLDQGIASTSDEVATYRGEILAMHGIAGDMAKMTAEESNGGKPTFRLKPWKAFSRGDVGSQTAEEPESCYPPRWPRRKNRLPPTSLGARQQ
jgi:hypothetical protein